MSRDTAINALLGMVLVLAFAAICLAYVIPVLLVVEGLRWLADAFFPAAWPKDTYFYALISIGIIVGCVRQIRRRVWSNAFLSAAAVVTIVVPLLLNPQPQPHPPGLALPFPMVWFIAIMLPQAAPVLRKEFIGCAGILTVAFALNTGLLGSGSFPTMVGVGVDLAVMAWILVKARDRRDGSHWNLFSPTNP